MRRILLSFATCLALALVNSPGAGVGELRAAVTDSPPAFVPPPNDPLSHPAFTALRRRYTEARSHHRAGRLNQADRLYRALVDDYSAMAGPIRRSLSSIAQRRSRHKESLEWAEALLSGEGVPAKALPMKPGQVDPSALRLGSMAAWGLLYRGEAMLALGRPQVAAASFEAALEAHGRGMPPRAQLHHQLGRAYERLGDYGDAYRHYLLAKRAGKDSSWGRAASTAADKVESELTWDDRGVRELLDAEIVKDLIEDGREREALTRIDEVMASCRVPEVREELSFNRSLCQARLAAPDEGVRLLHRLTYTPHLSGSQYWAIVHDLQVLLAKQRETDSRVNVLQRFLATFPSAEESIEARFILADVLSDQGRLGEAEALYRDVVRLYPNHKKADDARWALAWDFIRDGDLSGAFRVLEDHAATVLPGTRAEARAVYWLGRSAKKRGRTLLAEWLWIDVARRFPNSYYGVMAQWQTRGGVPTAVMGRRQAQLPSTFPVVTTALTADGGEIAAGVDSWVVGRSLLFPGFIELLGGVKDRSVAQTLARAMESAIMGNISEASVALSDARGDRRSGHRALQIVSAFYHSLGHMQSGMRVGHSHLEKAPIATYHGPREMRWALAYPLPFMKHFVREGYRQATQPALMAGMAQQESGFWPTARSSAGARGLMQLMPRTARGVAANLGMRRPELPELYKPTTNTRLGAAYIRDMLNLFDGSVPQALAAYNAGPGAVQRWQRSLGGADDDILVEEIPYTETRNYVRVVLRNYAGYRAVYPGLLYQRSAFPKAPAASSVATTRVAPPETSNAAVEGRGSAAPEEPPPDPDEPGGLFGPGGALDF